MNEIKLFNYDVLKKDSQLKLKQRLIKTKVKYTFFYYSVGLSYYGAFTESSDLENSKIINSNISVFVFFSKIRSKL